ncbi:MAG TPA: nitroreductase [Gammaproteobacteria bacterium]|nr:nitroreductase [Gammaproteobacteria bacterium]
MPMTVSDAIRTRRATRSYTGEPLTSEQIHTLLDAAIHAPSARNEQPWSFAIVQNRALLASLSAEIKSSLMHDPAWREHLPLADPDFDVFYGAGTVIVICARTEGFGPVGDCYLAAQNLMLAACELGLATCPIGLARDTLQSSTWRKRLGIPEGVQPVLPVAAGHPAANMPATTRRPPTIHAWIR